MAADVGLDEALKHEGPYTLFAPHNQAFSGLDRDERTGLDEPSLPDNLLSLHMVRDRHYLTELRNNMELSTLYQETADEDGRKVLINRYSNGVVTVNCARIILPDQTATNGVIHVLEKLIPPVNNEDTVMQKLMTEDNHEFGELVTALIVSGLGNILRDTTKTYTVFAPTDEAFRNVPEVVMDRILADPELLKKFIKYHIIESPICSAAIIGLTRQKTLEGQKANLTCDVNDRLRINDIPTEETDIVASNGVIHVIDEVLLPSSVKSIGEVLSELNLHQFVEYAQQAGMANILDAESDEKFTIFAPSAEAFSRLTRQQRRLLQTQPAAVRKVLQYHVVPGDISTKNFDGASSMSTYTDRSDAPTAKIRFSVRNKQFGVNGAKITVSNQHAGNGMIHVIDRVLFPPEGTTIDKLRDDGRLSTFRSLIQTAGMDGLLLKGDGNFTLFAPTNDAFDSLENDYVGTLMANPEQLNKFLKYHLLDRPIYTSAIEPELKYKFRTMVRDRIAMKQPEEEMPIMVNDDASILEDEQEATNGVVYIIDHVLRCPCIS